MGILQLTEEYGAYRIEAACRPAAELSSPSYTTVCRILNNRQENAAQPELFKPVAEHENLRGAAAFL